MISKPNPPSKSLFPSTLILRAPEHTADANDDMTQKKDGTPENYGSDYENQLISYNEPGTDNDATYKHYAGWEHRGEKNVNRTITKFLHEKD